MADVSNLFGAFQRTVLFYPPGGPTTYSHNHRVSGTVKVNGVAASKMVALFNRETMVMLAMKQSEADGTFEFSGIPEVSMPIHAEGVLVLALDSTEGFNAEVADRIDAVGIGEPVV